MATIQGSIHATESGLKGIITCAAKNDDEVVIMVAVMLELLGHIRDYYSVAGTTFQVPKTREELMIEAMKKYGIEPKKGE